MIDFQDCTLYASPRSPFARRIRIAFRSLKISYAEKIVNVLDLNHEVLKVNPVGRVPVVTLYNGQNIADSNQIMMALANTPGCPLFPSSERDFVEALNLSGVALGVCDKTIEYFFETTRPSEHQDLVWLKEIDTTIGESLVYFESRLKANPGLFSHSYQCTIDWGVALDYLVLRYPKMDVEEKFPDLWKFLLEMRSHEFFIQTNPPPVQ